MRVAVKCIMDACWESRLSGRPQYVPDCTILSNPPLPNHAKILPSLRPSSSTSPAITDKTSHRLRWKVVMWQICLSPVQKSQHSSCSCLRFGNAGRDRGWRAYEARITMGRNGRAQATCWPLMGSLAYDILLASCTCARAVVIFSAIGSGGERVERWEFYKTASVV